MNKKERYERNEHIYKQFLMGAKKKDLASIHGMTVQNVNNIIKNFVSEENDKFNESIKNNIEFSSPLNNIKYPLTRKNIKTIYFDTREEALLVLETILERIVLRGRACIGFFYLLYNMQYDKNSDNIVGWSDPKSFYLNTSVFYCGPDKGYRIRLARLESIEYDDLTDVESNIKK